MARHSVRHGNEQQCGDWYAIEWEAVGTDTEEVDGRPPTNKPQDGFRQSVIAATPGPVVQGHGLGRIFDRGSAAERISPGDDIVGRVSPQTPFELGALPGRLRSWPRPAMPPARRKHASR